MRWIVSLWHRWRGRRCCHDCGRWFGWPAQYWHEGEPLCSVECWAWSQPAGGRVYREFRDAHNNADCSH